MEQNKTEQKQSSRKRPKTNLLRSYPVFFARKVARLLPQLLEGGPAVQPCKNISLNDGKLLFWKMPDIAAEDCNLWPVIEYLRGSKKLRIPDEWRPFLPPNMQ